MSGVGERSAVSITSFSEVLVSLTAVFTYILIKGSVDWILTLCLVISVSFSAPVAAFVVKRTESGKHKVLIGVATFLNGPRYDSEGNSFTRRNGHTRTR